MRPVPAHWGDPDRYEAYVGRWSRLVAPLFVQWAGVPRDGPVLDVGCGTGALSAALLSSGVPEVHGVDISPKYVARAAAEVAAGTAPAFFEVGDATQLRFEDGKFAAAVSGLCLNFLSDPAASVAEMRRVVRPGGVIAAYVWDYADKMEVIRMLWDAATEVDPTNAAHLDEGRRFPLCRPAALEELFAGVGLASISSTPIDQPAVFGDFDDYWNPFLGGQGPAGSYVASLGDSDRERLRELLRERMPPAKDGSIALLARAWAVRGVKS